MSVATATFLDSFGRINCLTLRTNIDSVNYDRREGRRPTVGKGS